MTFDLFWSKYPRKVSKGRARKAWLKLTPGQIEKVLGVIDEHLQYWRAAGTEMQWIPYPASWLNDERYEDELVMPRLSTIDVLMRAGKNGASSGMGANVVQAFPQLVRQESGFDVDGSRPAGFGRVVGGGS